MKRADLLFVIFLVSLVVMAVVGLIVIAQQDYSGHLHEGHLERHYGMDCIVVEAYERLGITCDWEDFDPNASPIGE